MVAGVFTIPLEKLRLAAARSPGGEDRPTFRINQFIGDDANRLVQFAADAFLEPTTVAFNPLIFFGPTATGKTHLAYGLAARWKQAHPTQTLQTITGADYARGFASAVETNTVANFRQKHSSSDCFVIDGLDELISKAAAQAELCLTIDLLCNQEKRILITARKSPTELPNLLPTLASRLAAGLTVPFHAPGPAARLTILKQLSKLQGVTLPSDVLTLIAGSADTSETPFQTVPQLHHALLQLTSIANQHSLPITSEVARNLLLPSERAADLTLAKITTTVTKYFGVRAVDLRSPSRRQLVVRARGVAVYLARKLTSAKLEDIGREFGGRDHTTILHACRKTEDLLASDSIIRKAVDDLTQLLSQLKTL